MITRQVFCVAQLFALSTFYVVAVFANDVLLDPSFNGTGYSVQAAIPPPERSFARAFVVQPDGKIVVAGDTYGGGPFPEKLAIMRFNANGTIDTSFGTGGTTITLVQNANNANRVVLQPDGKILVCGWSYLDGQRYNMILLRYTSTGQLDTSFNQTGYSVVNISGETFDYGTDIGLLSDGKIMMIGNTAGFVNLPRDHVLVRYNTDGTLDSTFNGTGILVIGDPNLDESASRLVIQPGDKMLIAGNRHNGSRHEYMLMRLNADGTPDNSFGTGGITTTAANPGDSAIASIDLRPDGKIVAVGWGKAARYSADGILDSTFGTGGVVTLPPLAPTDHIRIVNGNKMLLAGNLRVIRLMPNGALDYHFNAGVRNLNIPGNTCQGHSVLPENNSRFLLLATCTPSSGMSSFGLIRYQETRTKRFLDFNGDGNSDLSLFRPSGGQWLYLNSATLTEQTAASSFGLATDRPVPADFTGDGRTDVAVFRPSTGEWLILRSDDGTMISYAFGTAGDIPVTSDFDGDDVTDHTVFRPSTGTWWINRSSAGLTVTNFGLPGDKPVSSDYDGDFKADIAIYRPSNGQWWIRRSTDGVTYAFEFGNSSDITVQGDYTGDGRTDAAFYRPSNGYWFILRSEDFSYFAHPFGLSQDIPVPGQYGGSPNFDYVIFRPSTNTWHVLMNEGTLYFNRVFGQTGDQPLAPFLTP